LAQAQQLGGGSSSVGVVSELLMVLHICFHGTALQVTGSFGSQLSLLLSDEQVHSQAVQQHCCYTVESHPQRLPQRRAAAKRDQGDRLGTEQGSRAMMVDKLLKDFPGLNGTGVKVGELTAGSRAANACQRCAICGGCSLLG
jgi:hypothetical protein